MNKFLKNWLSLNSNLLNKNGQIFILTVFVVLFGKSQVVNYVSNGGFEKKTNCLNIFLSNAKNWDEIDSNTGFIFCHSCLNKVPYNGFGFQFPKSGEAYVLADAWCINCSPIARRAYARNTLRNKLQANQVYCVKFYININNNSTYGSDGFAAYFGDETLDTIKYGHKVLNYLVPQVSNPDNNIISDTLNWTAITGTFTANGNEKYMVIGNFKTEAATNTILILPTFSNNPFTTFCLDDVSCITIDLPAYAGKDTSCIPGTTVYIGRTRDVGIDEACTWFKWPDMVTPIATGVAGLTVSPVQTTTYIVKQQLWCSGIKYDTVVVYKDGVGLSEFRFKSEDLRIYPVPASDVLIIETQSPGGDEAQSEGFRVQIVNSLGQLIRQEEIKFLTKKAQIKTSDLPDGVYILHLKSNNQNTVSKRFVISR